MQSEESSSVSASLRRPASQLQLVQGRGHSVHSASELLRSQLKATLLTALEPAVQV